MTLRAECDGVLQLLWSRGGSWASCLALVAGAACGGHTPDSFTDGSDDSSGDDAAPSNGGGGGLGANDAGGFTFADDASLPTGGSCVPGTYRGSFTCDVTLLAFIKFPLGGPISFTFAGEQTGGGEFTRLSIAPGAKMNATDDKGDDFVADLSGSLDCTTDQMTGTMTNATMKIGEGWAPGLNPSTGNTLRFAGDLRAGYDGVSAPPALVNGQMTMNSPDLGGDAGPTGACTWTASLNGPLPDGGVLDDAGPPSDATGD